MTLQRNNSSVSHRDAMQRIDKEDVGRRVRAQPASGCVLVERIKRDLQDRSPQRLSGALVALHTEDQEATTWFKDVLFAEEQQPKKEAHLAANVCLHLILETPGFISLAVYRKQQTQNTVRGSTAPRKPGF